MDNLEKKANTQLTVLENIVKFVEKYGYIKIICVTFLMLFVSYSSYLFINPSIMFEKYSQYEEKKHSMSFNYRMESSPKVEAYLNRMLIETGAARCYVIEMHNGKYNSAGLSFNYGAMTYEETRDTVESAREDYSDFSLDRYQFITKMYKKGYWSGTVDDVKRLDKKFAYKLIANDTEFVAFATLYGEDNEIGFIGVSFIKGDTYNVDAVNSALYRYSTIISPLLDGSQALKD